MFLFVPLLFINLIYKILSNYDKRHIKTFFCSVIFVIKQPCFYFYYISVTTLQCYITLQSILILWQLQQFNSSMLGEQQLKEMCKGAIKSMDQSLVDKLTTIFIDPSSYNTLMSAILDPYVSFMFCLIIKKYLKGRTNTIQACQSSSIDHPKHQNSDIENRIQIAKSTQFYQYLQSFKNTSQKRKHNDEALFSESNSSATERKYKTVIKSKWSQEWYESVTFANILIFSRCMRNIQSLSPLITFLNEQQKLKDFILAKFLIKILLQWQISPKVSEQFQDIVKKMVNYNEQNPIQSIQHAINILYELIISLEDLQAFKIKRIVRSIGKKIISILNDYLQRQIEIYLSQRQPSKRIQKILSAINQYLSVTIGSVNIYSYSGWKDDELDLFHKKKYGYHGTVDFHSSFIQSAVKLITKATNEDYQIYATTFMQVIDKITTFTFIQDNYDILCSKDYQSFQSNLNDFMNILIVRNMEQIDDSEYDSQYYLEQMIINVLGNILNNYLPFFISHKNLLSLVLKQYLLKIMNKAPIRISCGQKAVINSLFCLMIDIVRMNKSMLKDTSIEQSVRIITQNFLQRCCRQSYDETYVSYEDQFQSVSLFFDPIVQLIEKINIYSTKLLQLVDIHMGKKDQMLLIGLLGTQIIRRFQSCKIPQISLQRYNLLQLLMKHLSKYNNILYLMLLDIVSYKIIQDLDENTEFVTLYLNSKTNYVLPQFISFIAHQIMQFILTGKSIYLANYSIYLLTRLYDRFQMIQLTKKERMADKYQNFVSLHRYLSPVSDFISNLNLTVLDDNDNFQQRENLFKLICYVGINNIDDLYRVYSIVRQNLFKHSELKYMMDTAGLLNASKNERIQQAILELIFIDLNQHLSFFEIFNSSSLAVEINFKIVARFIIKLMNKLTKLYKDNKSLAANFQHIFKGKFDVFADVYDETNFKEIHQIYLIFTYIQSTTIKFPVLPPVIYSSSNSSSIVDWIFNHLDRLQNIEELKKLIYNTFQRKCIVFEKHIEADLKKQIIQSNSSSEYLLLLADFIDGQRITLFFDYHETVRDILGQLYQNYREANSSAATLDSFGFYDDYQQKEQSENVDYLKDFYTRYEYERKIKQLMKASHILEFAANNKETSFTQFSNNFMEDLKDQLLMIEYY